MPDPTPTTAPTTAPTTEVPNPAAPPPAAPPPAPPAIIPPAAAAPPPVATPPAAAPPAPTTVDPTADPSWLKSRLDARDKTTERRLLAELGFSSVEVAKAAAAEGKAKADASKTAEQRAAELAATLHTAQTEAQRNAAIIAEHAGRMLGVLTPKQQELVRSLAGDDPATQLATIQKLTDSQVLTIDDEPAGAPAAPPPATTAPPPTAPGGAPGTSPPDHQAVYGQLRQSNPFKAAAYGARNPSVYQPKS